MATITAGPTILVDYARPLIDQGGFLAADSYKVALLDSSSNIATVAASATPTFASVTGEIAAVNGYSAGGVAVTLTKSGTTTRKWDFTDPTFNADGGSLQARYACLYEVGGNVLAYWLLDSSNVDVIQVDGFPITLQINVNGLFQIA